MRFHIFLIHKVSDQNDILTRRLVYFIAERSATVNTNIIVFVSFRQDKEEMFSNRNSLFTLGAVEKGS